MTKLYLGWYEDNPKKGVVTRIEEAIRAYRKKFEIDPTVVLVSKDEEVPAAVDGCPTRVENFIRRNNYWVGVDT